MKELILKCIGNEDDYLRIGKLDDEAYYIEVTENNPCEISKSNVNLDKDSLIKLYNFIGEHLK